MGNDIPWGMADNGELHQLDMIGNGWWKIIGNYGQWEMTDNGRIPVKWKWQTIGNYRPGELQTM